MIKHTQTIRRRELINRLSVFDHLFGLALKGLIVILLEICKLVNMNHYFIVVSFSFLY